MCECVYSYINERKYTPSDTGTLFNCRCASVALLQWQSAGLTGITINENKHFCAKATQKKGLNKLMSASDDKITIFEHFESLKRTLLVFIFSLKQKVNLTIAFACLACKPSSENISILANLRALLARQLFQFLKWKLDNCVGFLFLCILTFQLHNSLHTL